MGFWVVIGVSCLDFGVVSQAIAILMGLARDVCAHLHVAAATAEQGLHMSGQPTRLPACARVQGSGKALMSVSRRNLLYKVDKHSLPQCTVTLCPLCQLSQWSLDPQDVK